MNEPCALWTCPEPAYVRSALARMFAREQSKKSLFFRVDDVGVSDERCLRLFALFRKYEIPLSVAVVPAWAHGLASWCDTDFPLWRWQMHGYAHANHAYTGKKSEFGKDRSRAEKQRDLEQGRDILADVLGKAPTVFTPPWNRCDLETLELLVELEFTEVSRFSGARPEVVAGLVATDLCVDLHTRKEDNLDHAWEALLAQFEAGTKQRNCGVMLHHERMNEYAFTFLEGLLRLARG